MADHPARDAFVTGLIQSLESSMLSEKEMIKARKYAEALQDAEKAVELNPEWAQALLTLAAAPFRRQAL